MKRNREKGFTLVELIATIVVLAIILSIAIPSVTGVINTSYKQAYELNLKGLKETAKTYALAKNVRVEIGAQRIITIDEMIEEDSLEPVLDPRTKQVCEGYVILINNGGKYEYVPYLKCSDNFTSDDYGKTDLIPPTISILGSSPTTISIGSTYVDEGATAMDDVDGDITYKIIVTGEINTNVPGSYTMTYTVADTGGNMVSTNRTVVVIDDAAPVITFNPNGNATYARNRSLTISVVDMGGVDNSSLKYVWTTSAIEPDIDSFSSTFSNNGTINTPTGATGSYYLWVIASDNASNRKVSRSNIFNLDNEKPVITINGNVNVTINKGAEYVDAGAVVTDNVDTNIDLNVTSDLNINQIGTYHITYNAVDSSGNNANEKVRTINVIDVSAPVITILGNNPVSITVGEAYTDAGATAMDDVDGNVTNDIVITGTVNPNVPGTYTITYTVKDSSNNQAIASRTVNVTDNIAPTVVFGTNGNSVWAKSRSTTVTVSDAHSSVNTSSLKYQWTTSTTTPSEASFTTTFTNGAALNTPAGSSGGYYLWILAKDTVGNTSILRSNVFNIDNTIPVITLTGNATININVGSTYTDQGATSLDAHSGLNGNVTATGTVTTSIPGTYTITYNVSDSAGNAATPVTRTIIVIDNVAPTVAFGMNGNSTYAKSRSTTVTISDAHSSVNTSSLKYQWTTSTTAPSEASFSTTFTNGATVSTPAGVTGGYYLWILAKDTANNTIITRSNIFNLDNTVPVITVNPTSINLTIGDSYTDTGVTASDNINGNISTNVVRTGSLDTNTLGTYTYTYNVSDSAGNAAASKTRTINVYPKITNLGYVASKSVNGPVLITGMTPIKWNGSAWIDTTTSDTDWYNYTTADKKWANARTADGSMWVWIPRYAYQIASGYHTSSAGTINVKFLQTTTNTASDGSTVATSPTYSGSSQTNYIVHPAFKFGTTELPGIWVAKFKASGTAAALDVKPNVAQLKTLNLSNIFTNTRAMETRTRYGWGTSGVGLDTHALKNVDWGAVAYLSKSSYGKNSEVYINNSSTAIAGCSGGSVYASSYEGCQYEYSTTQGQGASTTGNIYGVYDMSGGSYEIIAAYIDNGNSVLTSSVSSLLNADSKYKDVYTVTTDDQSTNYSNASGRKGDALYETSPTYSGTNSWYNDNSEMPRTDRPVFLRGGIYSDGYAAGLFWFGWTSGGAGAGFRPVIVVGNGL